MKPSLGIRAVVLLLFIAFSSSCTKMDAPEAAARINFLEWAGNIRTPYRHESFRTINNDGTFSTVRIAVELMLKGEWKEKQVDIQCEKMDKNWQCEHSMQFK